MIWPRLDTPIDQSPIIGPTPTDSKTGGAYDFQRYALGNYDEIYHLWNNAEFPLSGDVPNYQTEWDGLVEPDSLTVSRYDVSIFDHKDGLWNLGVCNPQGVPVARSEVVAMLQYVIGEFGVQSGELYDNSQQIDNARLDSYTIDHVRGLTDDLSLVSVSHSSRHIIDLPQLLELSAALAKHISANYGGDYPDLHRRCGRKENAHAPGYIYLLDARDTESFKIGRATDLDKRMRTFGVQLPFPVEVRHSIRVADMACAELFLHRRFEGKRLQGEWFNLSPEDVNWICSLKGEIDH